MIIKAEHVTKTIGRATVLRDISLSLTSGTVYGFVGRNGSGKTMLFRALSGLIHISSGQIWVNEKILGKDFSVIPNLGITIENVGMYEDLTGFENLRYFAKLNNKIGIPEIKIAINRVGLNSNDKRTYRKYSMGMKQRLAIAQAIMEKPDVIMLDEPTNGLDDDGAGLIHSIIKEEKQRGAIVLLASHSREDIRLLSDKVFRIEAGQIREESV